MIKQLLVFLFAISCISLFAQRAEQNSQEIPFDSSDDFYIVNCGEKGLVRFATDYDDEIMHVQWYDDKLEKKWEHKPDLDDDLSLVQALYDSLENRVVVFLSELGGVDKKLEEDDDAYIRVVTIYLKGSTPKVINLEYEVNLVQPIIIDNLYISNDKVCVVGTALPRRSLFDGDDDKSLYPVYSFGLNEKSFNAAKIPVITYDEQLTGSTVDDEGNIHFLVNLRADETDKGVLHVYKYNAQTELIERTATLLDKKGDVDIYETLIYNLPGKNRQFVFALFEENRSKNLKVVSCILQDGEVNNRQEVPANNIIRELNNRNDLRSLGGINYYRFHPQLYMLNNDDDFVIICEKAMLKDEITSSGGHKSYKVHGYRYEYAYLINYNSDGDYEGSSKLNMNHFLLPDRRPNLILGMSSLTKSGDTYVSYSDGTTFYITQFNNGRLMSTQRIRFETNYRNPSRGPFSMSTFHWHEEKFVASGYLYIRRRDREDTSRNGVHFIRTVNMGR